MGMWEVQNNLLIFEKEKDDLLNELDEGENMLLRTLYKRI